METLCTAIRTHLTNVHGLSSLRLQNHLYGCYILLEDIVQKNVILEGTLVKGTHRSFDLSTRFAEIGLRYGFAMDTQLLLVPCPADYQQAWIHAFTTTSTLEEVDRLEEKVSEIIEQVIPAEEGFFASTAETGSLPPQWVDHALSLLLPKEDTVQESIVPAVAVPSITPSVVPPKPLSIVLEKHKDNPKRMFASTRRKRIVMPPKKLLATTRRKPNV